MADTSELVLYSAPWCPYCVTLKAKFDSRGIAYTLRDVDEPGVREEMNARTDGNQTIPVVCKGTEYRVNPDEKALKEILQ